MISRKKSIAPRELEKVLQQSDIRDKISKFEWKISSKCSPSDFTWNQFDLFGNRDRTVKTREWMAAAVSCKVREHRNFVKSSNILFTDSKLNSVKLTFLLKSFTVNQFDEKNCNGGKFPKLPHCVEFTENSWNWLHKTQRNKVNDWMNSRKIREVGVAHSSGQVLTYYKMRSRFLRKNQHFFRPINVLLK